jgi:hypothetical protein
MLYLLTAMNALMAIGFFPVSPWIAAVSAATAIGCLITQIVIELMD